MSRFKIRPPAYHVDSVIRPLLCVALALGTGPSCGLLPSTAPPPVARGVVLVLASGFGAGRPTSRTPTLPRLAASGRWFDGVRARSRSGPARAALLGVEARSLAALFRSRGRRWRQSDPAARSPSSPTEWNLHLPGPVDEPSATRLAAWLRARSGPFLLVAALGGEPGPTPGLPPPATIAGPLAPPLPRIAIADLAFTDRPGGEQRPPAWSEPARQRAASAHLERSLETDRELAALVALVDAKHRARPWSSWPTRPRPRGATGCSRAGTPSSTTRSGRRWWCRFPGSRARAGSRPHRLDPRRGADAPRAGRARP